MTDDRKKPRRLPNEKLTQAELARAREAMQAGQTVTEVAESARCSVRSMQEYFARWRAERYIKQEKPPKIGPRFYTSNFEPS